jgi:phosphoglucosamine mutase
MSRLFGTDGVRGVANAELTPELAFKLGEAAGHFLGDHGRGRIVVGRDTRKSGELLESALVAGLLAGGADALVCGIVPTPAVALLVREMGADGGVVISASHNAPEYNGIKMFSRDGFKLPDELEDEIEAFCVDERDGWERPTGDGVGRIEPVDDALERYIAHCMSTIDIRLDGLTIAVDCGHGAAGVATPEALRRLGAKVVAINCESDGLDINVGSGSTDLRPLIELVAGDGIDLGIAHDGDADRVLAVDENGDEVDGDAIMAICAAHRFELGTLPHDTVVSTVMCNIGFEIAMRERDINVVKTKVGDRYVLEQMLTSGATLGGEQSGHIIFLDYNTTGDGLVTALQLAAVMRHTERPLSDLRQVMRRYPQVLVNVPVADRARLATSSAVAEAVHAAETELGDSGRVLVRPSGTEPLVRVMAEASEQATAQRIVDRLVAIVTRELS